MTAKNESHSVVEISKKSDDSVVTITSVKVEASQSSSFTWNGNSSPPLYETLDRGTADEKTCRICLQDDHREHMIAPCKCKGGSKWVHRQCLDQWRTHETDRAFSKCTECMFDYYLQPISSAAISPQVRRRVMYMLLVSRDLCLTTICLQLVIALLGLIVSWIDPKKQLPQYLNPEYPVMVYYLFGFLTFLVVLGIIGSIVLCTNGCSVKASLESFRTTTPDNDYDQPTYTTRSAYYQNRRETYNRQRDACNNFCDTCCLCCFCNPSTSPSYYSNPAICCFCCEGCEDDGNHNGENDNRGGRSSPSNGCDCNCDCCPGENGDSGCGDAVLILLVVLVIVAIFLAIIGFFIGIVLTVIIFQRTSQRHLYILHKRQLTNEFQVMDLAGYDLERPLQSNHNHDDRPSPSEEMNENAGNLSTKQPLPSPPTLPEKDMAYLKKLGLLEMS